MSSLIDKPQFQANAFYVGERIELRSLSLGKQLSGRPLTLALDQGGLAVLFRWGAVVFFDVESSIRQQVLARLQPLVEQPYATPESESAQIHIDAQVGERIDGGVITLPDTQVPRLQTVASALGKTVALAQYEADVAQGFDQIEPFARALEQSNLGGQRLRQLLHHIGRTLRNEQKLLGRVEVAEKPELLWEHPQLEPFYARLDAEYDLTERAALLDRKLELTSRTVSTIQGLLQQQRSHRVEWYIVALIVVEIVLGVYDMFWRRG